MLETSDGHVQLAHCARLVDGTCANGIVPCACAHIKKTRNHVQNRAK